MRTFAIICSVAFAITPFVACKAGSGSDSKKCSDPQDTSGLTAKSECLPAGKSEVNAGRGATPEVKVGNDPKSDVIVADNPEPEVDDSAEESPSANVDDDGSTNTSADDPSSTNVEAEVSTPTTPTMCLLGDCDPPAAPSLGITFSSLEYYPAGQTNCSLGGNALVVKSLYRNQFTIFWRANYAAIGRWQLFARRVTVAADGTMAFDGDKVNLLPGCDGNTNGVTAFSITEYADGTGATTRAISLSEAENVSHVKVAITCVNSAQSDTKILSLETLTAQAASTVPFLDAKGYWSEKGVYLKSNAQSLNADGTAGSVIIGSFPTTITEVYGSDAGGIYVRGANSKTYYIKNDLSFAESALGTPVGAFKDSTHGFVAVHDTSPSGNGVESISRWSTNIEITKSNDLFSNDYYSSGDEIFVFSRAGRHSIWYSDRGYSSCRNSTTNYSCGLYALDLSNGTLASSVTNRTALDYSNGTFGFLGARIMTSYLSSGSAGQGIIYLSSPYFQ